MLPGSKTSGTIRWTKVLNRLDFQWMPNPFGLGHRPRSASNKLHESFCKQMNVILDFEKAVSTALINAGCTAYDLTDFRLDNRECRDFVYEDLSQDGDDIVEPFVNFVVVQDVAIFSFFDRELTVYIFPCVESELIAQTNAFALGDVAQHLALLRDFYRKDVPDAVVERSVAERWLGV